MAINRENVLMKRSLEIENRECLERVVEMETRKIRLSSLNTLTALVNVLEAKDMYLNGNSKKVAEFSVVLATELGIAQKGIEQILTASLLHDIGRVGVREAVMNKSGKLTDKELEHVKEHCKIGENIVRPILEDEEILGMIRHHHERYDGNGYPDGLSGLSIPLGARILKVVDSYIALISDRPYRKQVDIDTACEELIRGKGTSFDPDIVEAFVRIVKKSPRENLDISSPICH